MWKPGSYMSYNSTSMTFKITVAGREADK